MTTEEIDHYNELHLIHTYAIAALAKAISFTLAMADNPKIGPNMTWSAMLAESAPNRAKRARRREDDHGGIRAQRHDEDQARYSNNAEGHRWR